jgi:hypothetical protein
VEERNQQLEQSQAQVQELTDVVHHWGIMKDLVCSS